MPMFLFARFHARPGSEAAVRQAIAAVLEPTRREPGCLYARFFVSKRDAALFFLHSGWRSEDDFELHTRLPHTVRFLDALPALLDREPEIHRSWECEAAQSAVD